MDRMKSTACVMLGALLSSSCLANTEDLSLGVSSQALEGYEVYLGSLHGHSNYSDGDNPPRDVFTWAKNSGNFDFYILSDHAELLSNSEWSGIASLANEFNQDG